jgi:hypothetical protein
LTGGVVLDFFARTKNFIHEDPLLNFLAEEDDMEDAIAFLINDGFVKLDDHEEDFGYWGCNHLYVHPNCSTRAKKQVKVLLCGYFYSPINLFLSGNNQMPLHTTLDFNIATWNKAYSVFPSLTFLGNKGYVTGPITNHGEEVGGEDWHRPIAAHHRFAPAGYRIKDISWDRYPDHIHPLMSRSRRFGDEHSFIIDLPTQGVTASHVPDDAIASCTIPPMRVPGLLKYIISR